MTKTTIFITTFVVALGLSSCAGTKVLKDAQPYKPVRSLASETDTTLKVSLDWVIVRGSPGSWARNADWDEYLLVIENLSATPVWVQDVEVVNSLGDSLKTAGDRKTLVRASKKSVRHYTDAGISIKAGMGTGVMLAAGAGVTVVGVGIVTAMAEAALLGGATSLGTAGTVATGLVVLGPALAPSPARIVVTYETTNGEQRLFIDTQQVLKDLHFNSEVDVIKKL
jgi:hypothetical protein